MKTMQGGVEMSDGGRASFVLSDEMRSFFNKIGVKSSGNKGKSHSGIFPTNVHPFYLCMIMGITKNRAGEPQPMRQTMVAQWRGDTAKWEQHISGLTFFLHCRGLGLVDDETSERVLAEMKVFFSEESNKEFTNEGYSLMNQFAQGGFEIIEDELEGISDLADWLSGYLNLLME